MRKIVKFGVFYFLAATAKELLRKALAPYNARLDRFVLTQLISGVSLSQREIAGSGEYGSVAVGAALTALCRRGLVANLGQFDRPRFNTMDDCYRLTDEGRSLLRQMAARQHFSTT